MGIYSPYAVAEFERPQWKPGENLTAAAFIGIALFIVLDVSVGIWRIFRKRTGYYYWSMKLGTLACAIDALGVILKYLMPNTRHIWGFYTILLLVGWSTYAPAQSLVLYSRLHLINESYRLQRWVLVMITSTIFFIIIPTWIVVWPAYDPDPKISSIWSPRDAIVERYNQIGNSGSRNLSDNPLRNQFQVILVILSGIYVWSLLGLLSLKPSVRQRRVMLDLIYVNVVIVIFDILVVTLLYLNRVGISHPIQTFSYALKFKLEFVVLNQLMAVAARGLQRESFEERRYHHSSAHNPFSAECRQWGEKRPTDPQNEHSDSVRYAPQESSLVDSAQPTMPKSVLSKGNQLLRQSATDSALDGHSNMDEEVLVFEQESRPDNFLDDDSDLSQAEENRAFSGENLRSRRNFRTKSPGSQVYSQHLRSAKKKAPQSMRHPHKHNVSQDAGNRRHSMRATSRRYIPRRKRNSGEEVEVAEEEEEEDGEIGVHMWENNGKLKMKTPWFKSKAEA